MKILHCPLNGPRNITEFSYGGELRQMPDPSRCTKAEWVNYVFYNENPAGIVIEWWHHDSTAYWFLAERDTVTDKIIRTFPSSDVFKDRVDFSNPTDTEQE